MILEELKKDLTEAEADVRSYLDHSEEYFQLKVFKVFMGSVTSLTQMVLFGAIGMLTLFIVSIGISLALNQVLDIFYIGFIITGMFYIVIGAICYFLRDKINKPILRKFSKHYFD